MPNHPSQKKRLRQSRKRRVGHTRGRSDIRTRTKNLLTMESAEEADAALAELYARIDRAARRRILQPNAAARQKSRLARHVASLSD